MRDRATIFESENDLASRVSSVVGLIRKGEKIHRIQVEPIKENRQEAMIACNILNAMIALGRPETLAIGV